MYILITYMTETEIKQFMNNYNKEGYNRRIGENIQNFKKVRIFLHGIIPDDSIELNLNNIISDQENNEEKTSKKNFYIPYDNNSLFSVYLENQSTEAYNLNTSFIKFLKDYYDTNNNIKNNQNNQNILSKEFIGNIDDKNKLETPINKANLYKDIFIKKLSAYDREKKDNYNLVSDLYIYSKLFSDTKSNKPDIMRDIFSYPYYQSEIQTRNPKYIPSNIVNNTNNIFQKYKEYVYTKDTTEPNDDYKNVVSFYNLYEILKLLLIPKKTKLKFKLKGDSDKETQFLIKTQIKPDAKYQELIKIGDNLEFHFNIDVDEIDELKTIKFILNFTGDFNKKNIDYLPKMLNPEYTSKNIYFTDDFLITNALLDRDDFRDGDGNKIDKRQFFLNKEFMKFLIDYNNRQPKQEDNKIISPSKQSRIFRDNVDLLIKYFFRQSKNPSGRYKNEGVIFYNDKEYYINKISNIDYFQTKPEKEFDTFDISFSDAKISVDYEDFTKKYYGDNGVNVIVNKNIDELLKLDPKNIDLSNNSMYFKPFREQIFYTKGLEYQKDLSNNYTLNLQTDVSNNINVKVSNIPFNDVNIIVDEGNRNVIDSLDSIYYKKKQYDIQKDKKEGKNVIDYKGENITLKDKSKQIKSKQIKSDLQNTDNTTYKISLELNILDKTSGPITFQRKLFSSSCNERCKNLDKTIETTFKPLLNGRNFNFFGNMLSGVKNRDKYNFQKVFEENSPKKDINSSSNSSLKLPKSSSMSSSNTPVKPKLSGGKNITYKQIYKDKYQKKKASVKKRSIKKTRLKKRTVKKKKSIKNKILLCKRYSRKRV